MTTLEQDVKAAEKALFKAIERPTADDFKRVRAWAGLTQENIADIAGVNIRTYQSWESGAYGCRKQTWELLKIKLEIA